MGVVLDVLLGPLAGFSTETYALVMREGTLGMLLTAYARWGWYCHLFGSLISGLRLLG